MATTTTKGKKVTCPECKKPFVEGYLGTHRRRQHGVHGGRSGKPRANGKHPTFAGFKPVEGMILLQDDKGELWVAERIK